MTGFYLKNGFRKSKLQYFSGEIEGLEYPSQLTFQKNQVHQYGEINKHGNVRFKLRSEKGEVKCFQFHHATFDFREGHLISILTSEKTNYHRLLVNHNTQRFWYPNSQPDSIAKEKLWERFPILFSVTSCFLVLLILLNILTRPFFETIIQFQYLFWPIGIILLFVMVSKVYPNPKRSRNEYLYETKFKPQLKSMGTKILEIYHQRIMKIKH